MLSWYCQRIKKDKEIPIISGFLCKLYFYTHIRVKVIITTTTRSATKETIIIVRYNTLPLLPYKKKTKQEMEENKKIKTN